LWGRAYEQGVLDARGIGLISLFAIGALVVLIMLFATLGALERTNAGEYAVVRNGGPFDNRNVRQVLDPAPG
jgi:hypothetical protein